MISIVIFTGQGLKLFMKVYPYNFKQKKSLNNKKKNKKEKENKKDKKKKKKIQKKNVFPLLIKMVKL